MNYADLARLIDGDAPAASEMLPGIDAVPAEAMRLNDLVEMLDNAGFLADGKSWTAFVESVIGVVQDRDKAISMLRNEHEALGEALEIIEHTLATLRGEK